MYAIRSYYALRPKGMARALQSVRRRLHLNDDPVTESVGSEPADPATEAPPAPSVAAVAPRGPVSYNFV